MDPIKLLTPHLPAIRAAAAIDYDGTGPASQLLSNYDLWLRMRGDKHEADYARGVVNAFNAWQKHEAEKTR